MKVYTISEERVNEGAWVQDSHDFGLMLGGGSNNVKVLLFRPNPAVIEDRKIKEAHPVATGRWYALAKPDHPSNKILVVVKSRAHYSLEGRDRRTGSWRFDSGRGQTLVTATGPRDYYKKQDYTNIGWNDALVVLSVGGSIIVTDENGIITRAVYESVESGLVQQSPPLREGTAVRFVAM